MKWNRKKLFYIIVLVSLAFAGLIIIQIMHLSQAVRQSHEIFHYNVSGALTSIVQKLETREMLKRIIRVSVGVDSTGSYNTTTMHVFDRDTNNNSKKFVFKNNRQFKSNVQIHNNKIVLHLRTERLVRLVKLDQNKKEVNTIFSEIRSAGIHEIPLDHLGEERFTHFNFYVDEVLYPFYLDKASPGRLVIDPELDETRHALLDKVLEQYLIFQPMPIEERVDFATLDSIVQVTLQEYGITLKANYGIISTKNDSIIYKTPGVRVETLRQSEFRTQLFPHDTFVEPNDLVIHFANQVTSSYKQLRSSVIITLLFLLAILGSFIFVIRTALLQNRFSRHLVEFINNMTHEFKTPLSTISIASETITKSEISTEPQRLQKYSNIIRDESSRMMKQVDKILNMAALENGDLELNFEMTDMHLLIQDSINHFRLNLNRLNGVIAYNLNAEYYQSNVDKIHIMNSLYNLMDNAAKYTNRHPDIEVFTENIDHFIKISVKDNGIGIRSNEMKKIFQKYYRISTGNIHNVKGFGLGLNYVKLIAEAHGGYVEVASQFDVYSVFSIYLPMCK